MLTPHALYPLLDALLQAGGFVPHATARHAVARLLALVLVAQDLRPSAILRILPAPWSTCARARFASVRRARHRAALASGALGPTLLRAALAWARWAGHGPAPGEPWLVCLDSVRCGRWEVFVLALGLPGRALPVLWMVLPYPWPKGRLRPAVLALVRRLLEAWPDHQRPCLLADRAFPSKQLFTLLAAFGASCVVRVQARHYVTRHTGSIDRVGAIFDATDPSVIHHEAVAFGDVTDSTWGRLVVAGQELLVVPAHQCGPASFQARARQRTKRHKDRTRRQAGTTQGAGRDDRLALFVLGADPFEALRWYGRRWAIEGTFRDLQGGWDGQHGWHFDAVVATCTTEAEVDRLTGLWALATLVQLGLGLSSGAASAPVPVRQARQGWATTPRVSWWWRGACLLGCPDPVLTRWVRRTLMAAATTLREAPPAILPEDVTLRPGPRKPRPAARPEATEAAA